MFVYLSLIALIAILGLVMLSHSTNTSSRLIYVAIITAALLGVSAVRRYSVGVDTKQFCDAYVRIGFEGVGAFEIERYEYLFTALCLWLNSISVDFQLLIVVTSALSIVPIGVLVYKWSDDIPLSFFLYITLNIYFSSMNLMRQSIALGIVSIGMIWLLKGKPMPFIVSVAVAFFFHQSAIYFLVLLVVKNIPFDNKVLITYLVATVTAFMLSGPLVNFVAGLYGRSALYDAEYMDSNFFGALLKTIVALASSLMCVNYFTVAKRDGATCEVDSLFQHGLMLWVFFSVLMMKVEIVGRLSEYFVLFAILAIPSALRRVSGWERTFVKVLVCCFFLAYFVIIGVARPEWYDAIPYLADFGRVAEIF